MAIRKNYIDEIHSLINEGKSNAEIKKNIYDAYGIYLEYEQIQSRRTRSEKDSIINTEGSPVYLNNSSEPIKQTQQSKSNTDYNDFNKGDNLGDILNELKVMSNEINELISKKENSIDNYENKAIPLDLLLEIMKEEKYRLGSPIVNQFVDNIKTRIKDLK